MEGYWPQCEVWEVSNEKMRRLNCDAVETEVTSSKSQREVVPRERE